MEKTDKGHVVFIGETGNLKCLNCGDILFLSRLFPLDLELSIEFIKVYCKRHKNCKPRNEKEN